MVILFGLARRAARQIEKASPTYYCPPKPTAPSAMCSMLLFATVKPEQFPMCKALREPPQLVRRKTQRERLHLLRDIDVGAAAAALLVADDFEQRIAHDRSERRLD